MKIENDRQYYIALKQLALLNAGRDNAVKNPCPDKILQQAVLEAADSLINEMRQVIGEYLEK